MRVPKSIFVFFGSVSFIPDMSNAKTTGQNTSFYL